MQSYSHTNLRTNKEISSLVRCIFMLLKFRGVLEGVESNHVTPAVPHGKDNFAPRRPRLLQTWPDLGCCVRINGTIGERLLKTTAWTCRNHFSQLGVVGHQGPNRLTDYISAKVSHPRGPRRMRIITQTEVTLRDSQEAPINMSMTINVGPLGAFSNF